jgi:hypothetical protein
MTGCEGTMMSNCEILAVSKILLESRAFTKAEIDTILSKMINGCVLDIYDEGSFRIYKISYSSFFMKDIEKFTKSILEGDCEIEYEDSWIPFVRSEYNEKISMDNIFKDILDPES